MGSTSEVVAWMRVAGPLALAEYPDILFLTVANVREAENLLVK
jgi:hypothetical protein